MQNLVANLTNPHQKDVFYKLMSVSDESQVYMAGFERNTDNKKKNTIGTITLMGTYNAKKNKRDVYEVKLYNSGKCSLFCNCPYQKFKSSKENTVCKHICFIVTKVAKHFDTEFYDTKILPTDVLNKLVERLETKVDCRKVEKLDIKNFQETEKPIEDVCPICYDDMSPDHNTIVCPSCKNHMHEECMTIWLERQTTCVYCRSDVWKHYADVCDGKTVSIVTTAL